MQRNFKFEPIPALEPVIKIPEKVVLQMSTDASLCYQLLLALHSGVLTPELGNRLCGTICHSRWNTTGQVLMMLWMSDHGLSWRYSGGLEPLSLFCARSTSPCFMKLSYCLGIFEINSLRRYLLPR